MGIILIPRGSNGYHLDTTMVAIGIILIHQGSDGYHIDTTMVAMGIILVRCDWYREVYLVLTMSLESPKHQPHHHE